MFNSHTAESQVVCDVTRSVHLNTNLSNVAKRNGRFLDCNNGHPFSDNDIQTRYKHLKEQLSSDHVYANQHATSSVCLENHHDGPTPNTNGNIRQSDSGPEYAGLGSAEFEANLLPLDQSFELMSHVASILDEWKDHSITQNPENVANIVKSKRRPYLEVQNPGNFPNSPSPFLQNALTVPKSPSTPYPQNCVSFEESQQYGVRADTGCTKTSNVRLHNDKGNAVKREPRKQTPTPISWDQTMPLQGKPLTSPLSQNNSQRATYWSNQNAHTQQDHVHSPLRLSRTSRSPKSPRTSGTTRAPVSEGYFFGSGYVAPVATNKQNIEELIEIQQQITPRVLTHEELATDSLTDDGLFEGCCEKELLIDLFKELTDDLKQANAEQTISSQGGFDDINMDDFVALLSRSSTAVVRQEVAQNADKENTAVRAYQQKLPSFSSVFL